MLGENGVGDGGMNRLRMVNGLRLLLRRVLLLWRWLILHRRERWVDEGGGGRDGEDGARKSSLLRSWFRGGFARSSGLGSRSGNVMVLGRLLSLESRLCDREKPCAVDLKCGETVRITRIESRTAWSGVDSAHLLRATVYAVGRLGISDFVATDLLPSAGIARSRRLHPLLLPTRAVFLPVLAPLSLLLSLFVDFWHGIVLRFVAGIRPLVVLSLRLRHRSFAALCSENGGKQRFE